MSTAKLLKTVYSEIRTLLGEGNYEASREQMMLLMGQFADLAYTYKDVLANSSEEQRAAVHEVFHNPVTFDDYDTMPEEVRPVWCLREMFNKYKYPIEGLTKYPWFKQIFEVYGKFVLNNT